MADETLREEHYAWLEKQRLDAERTMLAMSSDAFGSGQDYFLDIQDLSFTESPEPSQLVNSSLSEIDVSAIPTDKSLQPEAELPPTPDEAAPEPQAEEFSEPLGDTAEAGYTYETPQEDLSDLALGSLSENVGGMFNDVPELETEPPPEYDNPLGDTASIGFESPQVPEQPAGPLTEEDIRNLQAPFPPGIGRAITDPEEAQAAREQASKLEPNFIPEPPDQRVGASQFANMPIESANEAGDSTHFQPETAGQTAMGEIGQSAVDSVTNGQEIILDILSRLITNQNHINARLEMIRDKIDMDEESDLV